MIVAADVYSYIIASLQVGIKNSMWNHTHHNEDGDDAMGWSRVYAEEIE